MLTENTVFAVEPDRLQPKAPHSYEPIGIILPAEGKKSEKSSIKWLLRQESKQKVGESEYNHSRNRRNNQRIARIAAAGRARHLSVYPRGRTNSY